jgi:hypothetical protein
MILLKHTDVLIQIKGLQGVKTTTTSFHSLEDWRDLLLSLLSSLTPWSTPTPLKRQLWLGGGRGMAQCLPLHQPLGSYLPEN